MSRLRLVRDLRDLGVELWRVRLIVGVVFGGDRSTTALRATYQAASRARDLADTAKAVKSQLWSAVK